MSKKSADKKKRSKEQQQEENQKRKQKMINTVLNNYRQVEQSIVNQLFMKHDLHGTTIGSEREQIWAELFAMIVPKKFVIEPSVFIIDSEGLVSHEVDFAILDETYTPYIFRYGRIKFVPIEAVSAVIECKSQKLEAKVLEDWAESIKALKTSVESVARMATSISTQPPPTQQSTRPIRILCALKNECPPEVKAYFDFTLLAHSSQVDEHGSIDIESHLDGEEDLDGKQQTLNRWYNSLNHHLSEQRNLDKIVGANSLEKINFSEYTVQDQDKNPISLLSFNFQLNQLLMLINNPILFPHRAYARLFNSSGKDEG